MKRKSNYFYFVSDKAPVEVDGGDLVFESPNLIDTLLGQTKPLAVKLQHGMKWAVIHKFQRKAPHKYLGVVR